MALGTIEYDSKTSQVTLRLTNTSERSVTAFRIVCHTLYRESPPASYYHSTEYAGVLEYGEIFESRRLKDAILPGEEVTLTFHPAQRNGAGEPADIEVSLDAAVFEDHTVYGGRQYLEAVLKERAQRLLETSYWISRLSEAAQAADVGGVLARVDSELRSITAGTRSGPTKGDATASLRSEVEGVVSQLLNASQPGKQDTLNQAVNLYVELLSLRRESLARSVSTSKGLDSK